MNNPFSNFQIGRMRHRELEAEVSRWSRGSDGDGRRSGRMALTVITMLGSVAVVATLVAQGMIF